LPRFPFPIFKGDKLRSYYFLRELSKYHEIHLVCLSDETILPEWKNEIELYCKSITIIYSTQWDIFLNLFKSIFSSKPFQVHYFKSDKIKSAIENIIYKEAIDVCYTQLIRMTENIPFPLIRNIRGRRLVLFLDYMDALSAGMEKRATNSSWYEKPFAKIEAKRLKNYEAEIGKEFDKCAMISISDFKELPQIIQDKTFILPNGVANDFFEEYNRHPKNLNSNSPIIIFTGNMNYRPNIDAAIFLVKQVGQILIKKFPEIIIYIVGVDPTYEVRNLASQNVIVTGFVPDMKEYLKKAHVFVSPLFLGSGLQNKLLEAMAIGLPVITTPLTQKSLGGIENQDLLVANDAQTFADLINKCFHNQSWAQQIGDNGREYVSRNFRWESWGIKLNDVLTELHTELNKENIRENLKV